MIGHHFQTIRAFGRVALCPPRPRNAFAPTRPRTVADGEAPGRPPGPMQRSGNRGRRTHPAPRSPTRRRASPRRSGAGSGTRRGTPPGPPAPRSTAGQLAARGPAAAGVIATASAPHRGRSTQVRQTRIKTGDGRLVAAYTGGGRLAAVYTRGAAGSSICTPPPPRRAAMYTAPSAKPGLEPTARVDAEAAMDTYAYRYDIAPCRAMRRRGGAAPRRGARRRGC